MGYIAVRIDRATANVRRDSRSDAQVDVNAHADARASVDVKNFRGAREMQKDLAMTLIKPKEPVKSVDPHIGSKIDVSV